jgi:RNase adaptor protein for sRNA GlmZ degradation
MRNNLLVEIRSFSYHISGIPQDPSGNNGGFVFDCRFLPNPGRLEHLKHLTGKDQPIISYLENRPEVADFINHVKAILDAAISNYLERKFDHLMVSFGCTGGRHRSVYCSEQIAKHLSGKGLKITLKHNELEGSTQ